MPSSASLLRAGRHLWMPCLASPRITDRLSSNSPHLTHRAVRGARHDTRPPRLPQALGGCALSRLPGCRRRARRYTPPRTLDATLLRAVGDAVLPEAIGPDGREVAVGACEVWLSEFQPVAELRHPYGGLELAYGPPDPEPGWSGFTSADAVDRCYGVRITKLECRSIDDVGERPERLAP